MDEFIPHSVRSKAKLILLLLGCTLLNFACADESSDDQPHHRGGRQGHGRGQGHGFNDTNNPSPTPGGF